jgi:hypothetical protein
MWFGEACPSLQEAVPFGGFHPPLTAEAYPTLLLVVLDPVVPVRVDLVRTRDLSGAD